MQDFKQILSGALSAYAQGMAGGQGDPGAIADIAYQAHQRSQQQALHAWGQATTHLGVITQGLLVDPQQSTTPGEDGKSMAEIRMRQWLDMSGRQTNDPVTRKMMQDTYRLTMNMLGEAARTADVKDLNSSFLRNDFSALSGLSEDMLNDTQYQQMLERFGPIYNELYNIKHDPNMQDMVFDGAEGFINDILALVDEGPLEAFDRANPKTAELLGKLGQTSVEAVRNAAGRVQSEAGINNFMGAMDRISTDVFSGQLDFGTGAVTPDGQGGWTLSEGAIGKLMERVPPHMGLRDQQSLVTRATHAGLDPRSAQGLMGRLAVRFAQNWDPTNVTSAAYTDLVGDMAGVDASHFQAELARIQTAVDSQGPGNVIQGDFSLGHFAEAAWKSLGSVDLQTLGTLMVKNASALEELGAIKASELFGNKEILNTLISQQTTQQKQLARLHAGAQNSAGLKAQFKMLASFLAEGKVDEEGLQNFIVSFAPSTLSGLGDLKLPPFAGQVMTMYNRATTTRGRAAAIAEWLRAAPNVMANVDPETRDELRGRVELLAQMLDNSIEVGNSLKGIEDPNLVWDALPGDIKYLENDPMRGFMAAIAAGFDDQQGAGPTVREQEAKEEAEGTTPERYEDPRARSAPAAMYPGYR